MCPMNPLYIYIFLLFFLLPITVTPQVEPTQNTSTIAIRNYTNGTIDPIAIKPCPKPYTFRIWKHREEDAMVLEDTVEMPVDIWRWASVNGSYIRTTEKLNSLSIPFMYDYNFMGWCKASELEYMSPRTTWVCMIYSLRKSEWSQL